MKTPVLPHDFYFLRHGQTAWNVAGRLQGWIDTPLNATGLEQAKSARKKLGNIPFKQVVSSDLLRAVRTAELACDGRNLPHFIEPELRERRFGDWEGFRSYADLNLPMTRETATTRPHLSHDIAPPGGETWNDFKRRTMSAMHHVLSEYGTNCLIVGHGYTYVALAETLLGIDEMCDNCLPYHVYQKGGKWHMDLIGKPHKR